MRSREVWAVTGRSRTHLRYVAYILSQRGADGVRSGRRAWPSGDNLPNQDPLIVGKRKRFVHDRHDDARNLPPHTRRTRRGAAVRGRPGGREWGQRARAEQPERRYGGPAVHHQHSGRHAEGLARAFGANAISGRARGCRLDIRHESPVPQEPGGVLARQVRLARAGAAPQQDAAVQDKSRRAGCALRSHEVS